jgi:hypothetical protein
MKFDIAYNKYLRESNYAGSGGAFGDTSSPYNDGDNRPVVPADIVLGKKKKKKKKKMEEDQIAHTKGPVQTRSKIERVFGHI